MNPTEVIANFVLNTSLDQIPSAVISKAETLVLDCIGVMIAGSRNPSIEIITQFIKETGGNPQASVVGKGIQTSAYLAALANGSMAHILDYDDTSRSMRDGHPSAPVFPAVLALGEKEGTSGRKILESYILGTEVEMKIGSIVIPAHADKGWHTTGTLGTIGSAVAASKILDLDKEKTCMSIGIASSQAAGISENFGTMTKSFHAGAAAKNGIIAALLAKQGFTASQNALHGKLGFYGVLCEDTPHGLEKISERLGNPYDFIYPGVDVKRYPSCSSTHCAIEGIIEMAQKYHFDHKDVKKITCGVSYKVPTVLIHPFPRTDLEAKSSMQFCLAVAMIDREVTAEQFSDDKVRDPQIQHLMKKIDMYVHPDLQTRESLNQEFTLLNVTLSNDIKYSLKIDKGQGSMRSPLKDKEVVTKYDQCVKPSLSDKDIERSIELIQAFRNLDNIRELMAILSGC